MYNTSNTAEFYKDLVKMAFYDELNSKCVFSLTEHCLELFNIANDILNSCETVEQYNVAKQYDQLLLARLKKDIFTSDAVKKKLIDPHALFDILTIMIKDAECNNYVREVDPNTPKPRKGVYCGDCKLKD